MEFGKAEKCLLEFEKWPFQTESKRKKEEKMITVNLTESKAKNKTKRDNRGSQECSRNKRETYYNLFMPSPPVFAFDSGSDEALEMQLSQTQSIFLINQL